MGALYWSSLVLQRHKPCMDTKTATPGVVFRGSDNNTITKPPFGPGAHLAVPCRRSLLFTLAKISKPNCGNSILLNFGGGDNNKDCLSVCCFQRI